MGSLATERNVLEEGLNVIKNAKLEFASPVSEMYGALQRQYAQVRTIKLQGKAQDYVKKVLHDSKFFCILTKLITQAIAQSKTNKQQTMNMNRVHKWYISNLHKLHFAEQPAFRLHDSDGEVQRTGSVSSRSYSRRAASASSITASAVIGADTVDKLPTQSRTPRVRQSRPKSVTWRESNARQSPPADETANTEELGEAETDVTKSETRSIASPSVTKPVSLDVVHSIAERRTPDYHLVDDSSYIDTVVSSNVLEAMATPRYNSPVSRSFTPIVYDYIEQIQREVNKVQGHPSDLYPELFTPHIVKAIIDENQELHPVKKLPVSEKGRDLREQSTEQFFDMADRYRPNTVRPLSALQPRRERIPRPKSSLPTAHSRPTTKQEQRSLQMKDVVSLVDFASAEISYEKDAGILKTVLNRPKVTPLTLPQQQLEIEAAPASEENTMLAILPAESVGSPTTSLPSASVVDWRGRVTPTCSDSQQEIFKTHSYARSSAKRLSASGRAVGGTSGGYRPRTAPVSKYHNKWRNEEKVNQERTPQAASNTLTEVDTNTTKALLNITNIKTSSPRRQKSASSAEIYGNYYMEYLTSNYAVPPTSIYEYESYAYEHEPIPKSYQFMEGGEGGEGPPSPRNVEYLTIVQSIAPDLSELRAKSKRDMRVEKANALVCRDDYHTTSAAESTTSEHEKEDICEKVVDNSKEEFKSGLNMGRPASTKSLVASPLFQFSAYPTPYGGVLRARSPAGRSKTIISAQDKQSSILQRAVTNINFEPPIVSEDYEEVRQKPKSAGKLMSSIDKSSQLVRPIRSAPSIPSVYGSYGSRSPRLLRNHPFSGEHDRSAHKHLNPQEYLKKVQAMRAEDVILEQTADDSSGELAGYLDVRPMSSRLELRSADLTVHNAIKFDKPSYPSPEEELCTSPAFLTESDGRDDTTPGYERVKSARPRSSRSNPPSRPQSSRPIPQYMKAEHWEKVDADTERQREAAAAVSIQKIFRGYVGRKVYLNLQRDYRTDQENKQISATRIQRSWRHHRSRLNHIYSKSAIKPDTLQWAKEFKLTQQQLKLDRELKREHSSSLVRRQVKDDKERLSIIGPHVEVYSAYHPPKTGSSKKQIHNAVVTIQRHVRGMQCRNYVNLVKEKAKDHSASWPEWVAYYKQFLRKILHRRGVDKPNIQIKLEQMQKFMAQKKRYESVFDRRSFGGELEEEEFVQFFKECDLMPANHEIEHAIDLVFKGKPRSKRTTFKKREVLDIVFEIYKPEGTGILNDRKSTWLHPIVDGEDAMKLLGSEMVEPTPLGPCLQLVANSMKERKQQAEEKERLRLLQQSNKRIQSVTANSTDSKPPASSQSSTNMTSDTKPLTSKTRPPTHKQTTSPDSDSAGENKQQTSASGDRPVQIFSNEPLYAPK